MKTIKLTVKNHWMDSLESAYVDVTSPTGNTIRIGKNNLIDYQMDKAPLTNSEDSILRRLLKETGHTPWKWEPDIFNATIEEMRSLLSISLKCSIN